jgi:aspartyl-tRNA(Asn)/glutamyl-tRNA(Gln) amidotransferase subunit C
MTLDRATVAKTARLARIALSDADLDKMTPQAGGVMKWVEQLAGINTDGIEPMESSIDVAAHLRPDAVTDGGKQADILANAPESMSGFFVVPKVVE